MSLIVPFAIWRPIQSHGGPMRADVGLVEHITTNNFSPFGFFSNPANKASSHLWIALDGTLEQYVDLANGAWAQAGGNANWASCEVAGNPGTVKTPEQSETLARVFAWGHRVLGWPVQASDNPGVGGLGWHGMGGAAWGGHLQCPGAQRVQQRGQVLARVAALLGAPTPPPPAPPTPPVGAQLTVDGVPGPQTYQALQRAVGVPADGQLGPVSWRAIQARCGAAVDGQPGPNTWKAVQRHVGVTADGVPGAQTWAAIQRALNAGRF